MGCSAIYAITLSELSVISRSIIVLNTNGKMIGRGVAILKRN